MGAYNEGEEVDDEGRSVSRWGRSRVADGKSWEREEEIRLDWAARSDPVQSRDGAGVGVGSALGSGAGCKFVLLTPQLLLQLQGCLWLWVAGRWLLLAACCLQ